jgi:integrase/recombinase XerD
VRPRLSTAQDAGAFFLSEAGEALALDTLSDVVRGHLVKAGFVGRGSCHLFRHACATQMLEGGADVRFVQELLGHASLETTQLYTRVTIDKLKAVHAATHPAARALRSGAPHRQPRGSGRLHCARHDLVENRSDDARSRRRRSSYAYRQSANNEQLLLWR